MAPDGGPVAENVLQIPVKSEAVLTALCLLPLVLFVHDQYVRSLGLKILVLP